MGANNIKALKQLGFYEDALFFRFQNQEIAALFNPPYLLKCTCNFFRKYDVVNVECDITVNGEQLAGTAKWQDVLKLYQFHKYLVYCLLPKVTDRHVRPGVQSQMKVNFAAQVTSSNMAAAFNALVTARYMNSRYQSTAAFVKEVTVCSTVSVVLQTAVTIIRFCIVN